MYATPLEPLPSVCAKSVASRLVQVKSLGMHKFLLPCMRGSDIVWLGMLWELQHFCLSWTLPQVWASELHVKRAGFRC